MAADRIYHQAWLRDVKTQDPALHRRVLRSKFGTKGARERERERERELLKHTRRKKFNNWWTFFKIGCLGFGGPMAVLALLQEELVNQEKVLTNEDFLEGAVLGDILPGPVTMDIVTYAGFKLRQWRGAVIATLAFLAPSFILMLVVAQVYDSVSSNAMVTEIFVCLGAAVTGIIVSVGIQLGGDVIADYTAMCICVWSFASSLIFDIDILLVVLMAGIAGMLLAIGRRKKDDHG